MCSRMPIAITRPLVDPRDEKIYTIRSTSMYIPENSLERGRECYERKGKMCAVIRTRAFNILLVAHIEPARETCTNTEASSPSARSKPITIDATHSSDKAASDDRSDVRGDEGCGGCVLRVVRRASGGRDRKTGR